jgi:tetratricopeptide (TPR) repeat protein
MKYRLLLLLLLLVPAFRSPGQVPKDSLFESTVQRGITHVYNLEFEAADQDFTTLVHFRPSHPAGHFFRAMVLWWKIMIDIDDRQYDQRFYDALDHVVSICDSMLERDENDIDAIFFKGGSIGFEGRLRFHRDEWMEAANAGRQALPLVRKASELDPGNYDIYLGTGIYNYYAEVIPNEYPVVKPLMLFVPAGDKAKGLEQLTIASQKAKYAGVETSYFLMQIYYSFERDYTKALALARSLHERFPGNMVFHKYLGRCYTVMGTYEQASGIWAEVQAKCRKGVRGYTANVEREAAYYLGTCATALQRYDEALVHLYRCDELSRQLDVKEPSGFMTMANLKIGNVYDLLGKRERARAQYTKVLGLKSYKDAHQQAERCMTTPYAQ